MAEPSATEVLASIERRRGHVTDDQRFLAEHAPGFLAHYEALYDASLDSDAGLPIRVREFVAIAVLLARGASDHGIERHIRRAIDHGATVPELLGVLQAAVLPGGGPVFNRGLTILRRVAASST